MRYELYYWPDIQGRGEFVRLVLEDAQADYIDVMRQDSGQRGKAAQDDMMKLLDGTRVARPPFAPPFLKAGSLLIGQTANILMYLGPRHNLAPKAESARLWTHQLQLTIADFVQEIHDTHHPIGTDLYYEDQKKEAKRYAQSFREKRAPKYGAYFEQIIDQSGGPYLLGRRITYADLSLFQIVDGLRFAFPKMAARLARKHPLTAALHARIAARENIARYLASERRIAFNEYGIFRHYPELDG